jgi:hypothetical protein
VNRDLAFGAAGAIVAGGYYWQAASIPDTVLADAVGPRGMPIAYAAVLLVLSLILIARSLRDRGSGIRDVKGFGFPGGSPIPDPRSPRVFRVTGMLAIGIGYVVVVPWLGYLATLACLIFVTSWYQSGIATRTTAVVAVAGAIVFWLVFVALLGIPQPPGIWMERF